MWIFQILKVKTQVHQQVQFQTIYYHLFMFVHNTEPSFSSLKMGYPNYIIIYHINRENYDSSTLPVGLGVAHFQTHPVPQDSPMGVQDGEEGLPWGLSGRAAHVVHASQEFSCGPGNKNRRGDENQQQQQWPEIWTNVMKMWFMLFFIFCVCIAWIIHTGVNLHF